MIEKLSTMSRQLYRNSTTMLDYLSLSHYDALLKFKDINETSYYINFAEKQNISIRELREKIKKEIINILIISSYFFLFNK